MRSFKMLQYTIKSIQVFISKGQCSMFGANKTATATGGLLQLRALDWDVDGI